MLVSNTSNKQCYWSYEKKVLLYTCRRQKIPWKGWRRPGRSNSSSVRRNFPIVTLIWELGSHLEATPHTCKWFHWAVIICIRFIHTRSGEAEPCQQWHWNFCNPTDGIINPAVPLHYVAADLQPWGGRWREESQISCCHLPAGDQWSPLDYPMGWWKNTSDSQVTSSDLHSSSKLCGLSLDREQTAHVKNQHLFISGNAC